MLCSVSDLSSSWDAYLGHVLAMLLGINEMCLPGRFLMWNVSRKEKKVFQTTTVTTEQN